MSSVRFDPISGKGRGQFDDPPLSTAPAPRSKIVRSMIVVEHFTNENAGSSAIRQTGQAARTGSGKIEEILRGPDNMAAPSLSKHYSNRSVKEDGTYMKGKQLVNDSKEKEGVWETNPALQTKPETNKSHLIPAKDTDGKFPCPHCTKTFLHAKHLKRHLLRHTGDRPYKCIMCSDTFSRADILKRHFQKCSIRRGNSSGASHGLFAQADLKTEKEAQIHAKNSSTHFVPAFGKQLDMLKVDLEFAETWTMMKIRDILGAGVDISHPTVRELFHAFKQNRFLDINSVYTILHRMLGADTTDFCEDFWQLCRSNPSYSQVMPKELLAGRELELAQEKINTVKAVEEEPQSAEPEGLDSDLGSFNFLDTHLRREDGTDWLASMDWASPDCNQVDYEPAYVSDNFDSRIQFFEADQHAERSFNDSAVSDGESTDAGSTWVSDYSGTHALEDNHPLRLIKPIVVQKGLLVYQNAKQRVQAGSSSSATSDGPNTALGAKHVVTTPPKKRSRKNQDGCKDAGDSEDDDDLTAKRRRTSKREVGIQPSFACPFAKKDPLKYRSCYAYVLKRVRDVKQHLSRFHQLPIYCPRCTNTFETEDERDEHIRASSCLIQRDATAFEGVTRAQKTLLGQRVSGKMTPSDQWFAIFDILFQGYTPRPRSAYINTELTMELEAFQDLMYAEGPMLISSTIRSIGLDISAIENVEDDSTALLQSAIQDGLQQVFQRWLENMPGCQQGSAKLTTLCRSSTSPTCHGMQGSEPSRSSSNTLFEDIQETSAPTEQGNSFQEYARYQDHALAQRISSSSEDLVPAASTPLNSNTDQQNSSSIRNTDIQPVVHDEDVIGDAAHLDSLAADGWEAFEIDTLESGDSWNFDAVFDEARAM